MAEGLRDGQDQAGAAAPVMIASTSRWPQAGLLVVGLGAALVLRLAVAGEQGNASTGAGLVFAGALLAMALSNGWHPGALRPAPFLMGVFGAVVLVAVPFWLRLTVATPSLDLPSSAFPVWALAVIPVAVAEEVFLRGILFRVIEAWWGPFAAAFVGAALFALLHVPLYGWGVLPIDFAAGFWLGGLRIASRSVTAPAVAHVLADLGSWWLL